MIFPALYFSAILFLSKTGYSYAWERYNDAFPDNAKYMNPVPLNETLRQMYADSSFKIKPVVPPTFSIVISFFYYELVYLLVGIRRAQLQSKEQPRTSLQMRCTDERSYQI